MHIKYVYPLIRLPVLPVVVLPCFLWDISWFQSVIVSWPGMSRNTVLSTYKQPSIFLSRQNNDDSNPNEIIPVLFDMYQILESSLNSFHKNNNFGDSKYLI